MKTLMSELSKRKLRLFEMFKSENTRLSVGQTEYLSKILDKYKRVDQSIYILRLFKLHLLVAKELDGALLTSKESVFVNNLLGRFTSSLSSSLVASTKVYIESFSDFMIIFDHFNDMDIPAINNTQLLFQSPAVLLDTFEEIERNYSKKRRRTININPYSSTEPCEVMFEKDGLFIINSNSHFLQAEADSMAHCANRHGDPSTQRLLSVWSKVDENDVTKWKAHVTIILNDCIFGSDGKIVSSNTGEIKGYANEKPDPKYYQFISEFFASAPYINSMKGGGYLEQNNLKFSDLPQQMQSVILSKKSNFITVFEKLVLNNGVLSDEVITQFKEAYGFEDKIILDEYNDLSEFASQFSLVRLDEYLKKEPSNFWMLNDKDKRGIIEEIANISPSNNALLLDYVTNGNREFFDALGYANAEGIFMWGKSNLHEIMKILDDSVRYGHTAVPRDEINIEIEHTIQQNMKSMGVKIDAPNGFDNTVTMTIDAKDCLRFMYNFMLDEVGDVANLETFTQDSETFALLTKNDVTSSYLKEIIIEMLSEDRPAIDMDLIYRKDLAVNHAYDQFAKIGISLDKQAPDSFLNIYAEEELKDSRHMISEVHSPSISKNDSFAKPSL